jgi:hypothetical protein
MLDRLPRALPSGVCCIKTLQTPHTHTHLLLCCLHTCPFACACSIWTEQQEQQQAAVAAAVEALEGLDLETLDLLSSASKQEQAQVEKALSLTQSLGSRSTTAAGGLSLSSSLRDGGMFGPLSPALSSKAAQQLLLSPTASATGGAAAAAAAAMAAAAAAGGGWGGLLGSEPQQELPMEEMMTADIFDLE